MDENSITDNLFTIIDLGTESIRVIFARLDVEDGNIRILGYGDTRTNRRDGCEEQAVNIRKGKLRNAVDARRMLQRAFDEAIRKSGITVHGGNVYLGITENVVTEAVELEMRTGGANGLVTEDDMAEFTKRTREHYDCLETNTRKCLHTYTRYFLLDDKRVVYDAVNLASKRVSASVEGALCAQETLAAMTNLVKEVVGVQPIPLYIPLSIGYALDLGDELNSGVLLIDIGAGVTSFCISRCAGFVHAGHIPVGCNHIENDLMQAFGIEWGTARNIVRKMRDMNADIMNKDDKRQRMVEVEQSHGINRKRNVPVSSIEKVTRLRMKEMFSIVREELVKNSAWQHFAGSVILSGGGALIPGATELAEQVFGKPVRVAEPIELAGGRIYEDSRDVVPIGLLKMGVRDYKVRETLRDAGEEKLTAFQFIAKVRDALLNW